MGMPLERPASYEDIIDLPEHLVGEIINGRLVTHPRPAPKHARCYSSLGALLGNPYDFGRGGPGGWWILDEPELHLMGHVLVPDLAGWRRERMPRLPETAWFELAPDWVCEILSPGTARVDRAEKLPLYAALGVSHAWLVDPDLHLLEAYRNDAGHWLLLGTWQEDALAAIPPFDAIRLELALLWGQRDEPGSSPAP
jgi:Uma2 family endonuclease